MSRGSCARALNAPDTAAPCTRDASEMAHVAREEQIAGWAREGLPGRFTIPRVPLRTVDTPVGVTGEALVGSLKDALRAPRPAGRNVCMFAARTVPEGGTGCEVLHQ